MPDVALVLLDWLSCFGRKAQLHDSPPPPLCTTLGFRALGSAARVLAFTSRALFPSCPPKGWRWEEGQRLRRGGGGGEGRDFGAWGSGIL